MTNLVLAFGLLISAGQILAHPLSAVSLTFDEDNDTKGQQILPQFWQNARSPKQNTHMDFEKESGGGALGNHDHNSKAVNQVKFNCA